MPSGLLIDIFEVVRPSPSIRLKIGPAIQLVIAISPRPLFEIATVARVSPTELPQESTVNPSNVLEKPVEIPNNYNKSTIRLVVKYTQTMDIINDAI